MLICDRSVHPKQRTVYVERVLNRHSAKSPVNVPEHVRQRSYPLQGRKEFRIANFLALPGRTIKYSPSWTVCN